MKELTDYTDEALQEELDRRKKKVTVLTCYDCKHNHVCKYWDKWQSSFPYNNDACIKKYLIEIARILATACIHFARFKVT